LPARLSRSRRIPPSLLPALAAVLFSMLFLDRAAALWAYSHPWDAHHLAWLTYIVAPILPLAATALALGRRRGWHRRPAGRVALACALSAALAFLAKELLKFAAGRLSPIAWIQTSNSWVKFGLFGFAPFHGGGDYASFPSGHMMLLMAVVAVLWRALPRWRGAFALAVLLVAAGLIGAAWHWASDVIAGGYLGALVGTAVRRRLVPEAPPERRSEQDAARAAREAMAQERI